MKRIAQNRKRITAVLMVLLLFVGAYFFGNKVVAPRRAATQAAGEAGAEAQAGEAEVDAPGAAEEVTAPVVVSSPSLVSGSAESGEDVPVSFFLADVQYLDLDSTIELMRECDVTVLTVPLAWSILEPEKGSFQVDSYWEKLDILAEQGFDFIFLLDASSRCILNEQEVVVCTSIPEWVYQEPGAMTMLDFIGSTGSARGSLSYSYPANQALYLDFCRRTIEAFDERYGESILGFAPGVMPEFEIKYPQENFAWVDFNEDAQNHFRAFLKEKYQTVQAMNNALGTSCLSFAEPMLPIINYNNSLANGQLVEAPLYVDYQLFREKELVQYLIPVYDLIHNAGYKTFSYFGQVLHPHDGIYAAGVATRLHDYVDVAVIDYNFYDGYGLVLDCALPAMMANYMKTAGYAEVWSGLYVEQLFYAGMNDYGFLQEAIDYIAADGSAGGVEIGGLQHSLHASEDGSVDIGLSYGKVERQAPARIAIYASEWNFYHSHGESPALINYFDDCLVQMYKIIQFELGRNVDILCDEAVLDGRLGQYDLVVLPGQFYVDAEVRQAIEDYLSAGGKAIQDFRFGEWDAYGVNQGSWSDGWFDIAAREALHAEEILTPVDESFAELGEVTLQAPYGLIPNCYAIAGADENTRYLFAGMDDRYFGTRTDNTICLCWQPQIQYKYAQTQEEQQACVRAIELAIDAVLDE